MATYKTIFQLRNDAANAFDGSISGLQVRISGQVKLLDSNKGFLFSKGFVEVPAAKQLTDLNTFTLDATINPDSVGNVRQNIMESQTPGIALFIEKNGKLVGSVNTSTGWKGVDSGTTIVQAKTFSKVRFTRDGSGLMNLEINNVNVGSINIPGPVVNVGETGFKIGTWVDGQRFQFVGSISEVEVKEGAVAGNFLQNLVIRESQLVSSIKTRFGLQRVNVYLNPDTSHARLQPIKDIMNAAGVQRLSDLGALKITMPIKMTRGKVMVAARKDSGITIDWATVASTFKIAPADKRRTLLSDLLTNRNSEAIIKKTVTARTGAPSASLPPLTAGRRITGFGTLPTTGTRLPVDVLRASPSLSLVAKPVLLTNFLKKIGSEFKLANHEILKHITDANPAAWPGTEGPRALIYSLSTIPIASSVIIAGTLDLTNTQLVIEPDVETLYIIAEQVLCGAGAKITWRQPVGSTPARADNPDLNGRGFGGQRAESTHHGHDGENAYAGETGISGANGYKAPNLEMWVKNLTGMPDIDTNGEDGFPGGRGQSGGRGGDGGIGGVGKRIWAFGWHCTEDPGDGGHGGNGGNGGAGGRGGNGGGGGGITIGVLEGTLTTTITNRSFLLKNQGGNAGRGGPGGPGGRGGNGGPSGRGETCADARDGRSGAQGQPGPQGPDGINRGQDGMNNFFEFSQEAWDDMLTRPWLAELSPSEVFPGNPITIRGSRFSHNDRVFVDAIMLTPTINADESITVTIPTSITGGEKTVFIRRQDGTESNRRNIWIRPLVDPFTSSLFAPNDTITIAGKAFLNGASVLINGNSIPATVTSPVSLRFTMPGTGGGGATATTISVQVRNPDGMVSNSRTATTPSILEIPFRYGTHNLIFNNFDDGIPSWDTFEGTYGSAEVWHELVDPVFGHPVLTAAFFIFYKYFLKGESNGGLATGFCTSLASLVAEKFWNGDVNAAAVTKASVHEFLTGLHGKLLSRESLIHFHDQGRQGIDRVLQTYREIEHTFLTGCDKTNMPLLFFIPSGAAWDDGYFDKLSDSHCVMPWRFAYPQGHAGASLSVDGLTTITDPDKVELYVWDCNAAIESRPKVIFKRDSGQIVFEFWSVDSSNNFVKKFSSADGVTLGMMRHGAYMGSDHDLPFSGPFGLTSFIIDFVLSPADIQVIDENGLRTGRIGNTILSEIPDSHPFYLAKGAYMLPPNKAYTRQITGLGSGTYTFNTIMPDGTTLVIENVTTAPGQTDVIGVNADASQIRITPGAEKQFNITLSRQIGQQARAFAISGVGGNAAAAIDITVSPEMSLVRIGNRTAPKTVEVKGLAIDKNVNTPLNRVNNVNLPTDHDLVISVTDWQSFQMNVDTLSFE